MVFRENRALAFGMSLFGVMLGLAMGPFITETLLEHYGWRGTLLVLAGFMLQRAPLSLAIWCPQDASKSKAKIQRPSCKGILNFSPFKNRYFVMFCLASAAHKFYFNPFVTHMPSFVVSLGWTLKEAAWLPTVIFIASTVVGFSVSFVSNWVSPTHRVFILMLAAAMGTLSVVILVTVGAYRGALVASVICGIHYGE